jgi:hypothetical protein
MLVIIPPSMVCHAIVPAKIRALINAQLPAECRGNDLHPLCADTHDRDSAITSHLECVRSRNIK